MKNLIITLSILTTQLLFSQKTLTYKFVEFDNQIEDIYGIYKLTHERDIIIYNDKISIEDAESGDVDVCPITLKRTEEWGSWYEINKNGVLYTMEVTSDDYQIRMYADVKNQTFFYTE